MLKVNNVTKVHDRESKSTVECLLTSRTDVLVIIAEMLNIANCLQNTMPEGRVLSSSCSFMLSLPC